MLHGFWLDECARVRPSPHVPSSNSGSKGKGDEDALKRDFRPVDLRQTVAETIAVEPTSKPCVRNPS